MRKIFFGLIALVLVASFRVASAQEVESGVGLVCDTAEQIEQFVGLQASVQDAQAVLDAVNAKAGTTSACGVILVAFHRKEVVKTLTVDGQTYAVTKIEVIAINPGGQWLQVPPLDQYTVFAAEGA